MVRDWERKRCVSCRVKAIAIGSMVIVGGVSVFFVLDDIFLQILGGILILLGAAVVVMLQTCREGRVAVDSVE